MAQDCCSNSYSFNGQPNGHQSLHSKPFLLRPASSRQVKQLRRSTWSSICGNNRGNQSNEDWAAPAFAPNEQLDSSLAEYQVMFQQMKHSFPLVAYGALHQMTMARIAELKANRLEAQHERNRKEEEERPLKTNLASNFNLVGMVDFFSNTLAKHNPQDPDVNNGRLRSSISAPLKQDKPYSGDGLRRGSAIGNDSSPSLWNRQERADTLLRKSAPPSFYQAPHSHSFSLLTKRIASTADVSSQFSDSDNLQQYRQEREDYPLRKSAPPSFYQAPHSHSFSLPTKRIASTADISSQFSDSDNLDFNFEHRMSDKIVKEEDYVNVFGTSHRRSMSDLSGLFIDDDDDGNKNIDASDHYDDKGLYSVRSETKLPRSPDAASQVVDGNQNDTDDNISLSFNAPQFIGLNLSLSSKSDESDSSHHANTMSFTSDLTLSDCCSTKSSNGLIVGFSHQRTIYDGNDLIVRFVKEE